MSQTPSRSHWLKRGVRFSGTPPSDGTMRRFVAHPARFLHKCVERAINSKAVSDQNRMPDSMTYAIGALIEPLSVAYNAVVRARPHLGQPVLIAGAGPIGLAMALCARAAGAYPVCITDLEQNRLDQARAMGFQCTLRVEMGWDRLETAQRIRDAMGVGCVPQIAFECTGAASSINSACYVGPHHTRSIQLMGAGTRGWRYTSASWMRESRDLIASHVHGFPRGGSFSSNDRDKSHAGPGQYHHLLPIHPVLAKRYPPSGFRGIRRRHPTHHTCLTLGEDARGVRYRCGSEQDGDQSAGELAGYARGSG